MAGGEPGMIIDGNRRYPIVVRMPEDLRRKIDEMKNCHYALQTADWFHLGQSPISKLRRRSTRSLARWASAAPPSW